MSQRKWFAGSLVLAPAALAAALLFSPTAHAGIGACGDIHVEADAQCEVVVEGGCEAMCTPLSVQASCAAEGYASCEGGCNVDAEVGCEADCSGSCVAQCEIEPAEFDCGVACNADCQGSCAASCDDSECEASCEATCSAECDASCTLEPGEADCMAQCDQCCTGSCTAEVNIDCQVDCQAELRAECVADVQGGCEVACSQPEGALFCDGNYVDHGGNLESCVNALKAAFNINVEGYAEASCEGNTCSAGAGFSCGASVRPERTSPLGFLGFMLGTGMLIGFTRLRRN